MEEVQKKGREIDFQEIFMLLRKYVWWLVIGAVVGGLLGFGYTKLRVTETYYSQVSFYCISAPGSTSSGELSSRGSLATHYEGLLKSEKVLGQIAEAIGGGLTAGQIRGMLQTSADVETAQVTIRVVSTNKLLPPSVCKYMVECAPEILNAATKGGTLEYLGFGDTYFAHSNGMPYRNNILIGALAVVAILVLVLLIRSMLNDTVTDAVRLQQRANVTVLGEVPAFEGMDNKHKRGYGYGRK